MYSYTQNPRRKRKFELRGGPIPLKHLKKFFGPAPDLTREEAMKVFRRDHFKCQYCGLDGLQVFDHWLVLTVDFVYPKAHGGSRRMDNLVTACRPCNIMKGKRIFASRQEAKRHVLEKREEWRREYREQVGAIAAAAAS
jgi:hypothetical protein